MEEFEPTNPTYKTLAFLVRHGDWVALVVAVLPAVAGIYAWAAVGMHVSYAIGGVAIGAFLYLIMRSYVELVRVIVDMLLPK